MLEFKDDPFSECKIPTSPRETLLASLVRNTRNRYFGHLTAKDFAESHGIDSNKLSKVESGYTLIPSEDLIKQICEAFATTPRNTTPLMIHYIYKAAQKNFLRAETYDRVMKCLVTGYLSECQYTHAFLTGIASVSTFKPERLEQSISVVNFSHIRRGVYTEEEVDEYLSLNVLFSYYPYSLNLFHYLDVAIFDEVFAIVNMSYNPTLIIDPSTISALVTTISRLSKPGFCCNKQQLVAFIKATNVLDINNRLRDTALLQHFVDSHSPENSRTTNKQEAAPALREQP